MIMEKSVFDLLDSPLWIYLTKASSTRFSVEEQISYMMAQHTWEDENFDARFVNTNSEGRGIK